MLKDSTAFPTLSPREKGEVACPTKGSCESAELLEEGRQNSERGWQCLELGAWSLSDCLGEVRNGASVLFYYIRVVYLVAQDSENLSRGTAEEPSD